MTNIAILGSGHVARALAHPLAARGHALTVGSRAPTGVTWPGDDVAVATIESAVEWAEIIINALPGAVSVQTLTHLRAALTGKILLDIANAVQTGADGFATTLLYPDSSVAEQIQAALPATSVVKSLNTMHDSLMANPTRLSNPLTVFVAGNDIAAKEPINRLLHDLGWPPEWIIDLGDLTASRWLEAFVLTVRPLIHTLGPVPFGLAIAH